MSQRYDFTVPTLGPATIPSPIKMSNTVGDHLVNYVRDDDRILYDIFTNPARTEFSVDRTQMLERSGPRGELYFDPSHVRVGVVSCGGLCPGINDVIRSIVRCLWFEYGVRRILGIRNGYKGFLPEYGFDDAELDPEIVDDIHNVGGSVLGTSRGGGEQTERIADAIERLNLNILFTIGGDGTQRGSTLIGKELERRGQKVAVVGIPKTIDNDLLIIQKSFGFETAVARASEAVLSAHTEAHSTINGIGLVKLMGRESGLIAAHTALSVNEANFVLIPEIPFELDGEKGLLRQLQHRLEVSNHAVIVVAEGAGQQLLESLNRTDASGNKVLADVGLFLKQRIQRYFNDLGIEINLRYIDPSYMIRSSKADSTDAFYSSRLGSNAVHAAMAGKTRVLVGLVNDHYVYLPTETVVAGRKHVDPEGSLWRDVLSATQQPEVMVNSAE